MTFTETDRLRFLQDLNQLVHAVERLGSLLVEWRAEAEPRRRAALTDQIRDAAQELKSQWALMRRAPSVFHEAAEEFWRPDRDRLDVPIIFARSAFEVEIEKLLLGAEAVQSAARSARSTPEP